MTQTHVAPARVSTDLTCWKCGEETLVEMTKAEESNPAKTLKPASLAIRHSECQKCGAYSVNAAQGQYNRVVARGNRKNIIKELNRKSG